MSELIDHINNPRPIITNPGRVHPAIVQSATTRGPPVFPLGREIELLEVYINGTEYNGRNLGVFPSDEAKFKGSFILRFDEEKLTVIGTGIQSYYSTTYMRDVDYSINVKPFNSSDLQPANILIESKEYDFLTLIQNIYYWFQPSDTGKTYFFTKTADGTEIRLVF